MTENVETTMIVDLDEVNFKHLQNYDELILPVDLSEHPYTKSVIIRRHCETRQKTSEEIDSLEVLLKEAEGLMNDINMYEYKIMKLKDMLETNRNARNALMLRRELDRFLGAKRTIKKE